MIMEGYKNYGKKKMAGYQHFLLFQQFFQMPLLGPQKPEIV